MDFISYREGGFLINIGNDNPGAFPSKTDGKRPADSLAGARNDRGSIFKSPRPILIGAACSCFWLIGHLEFRNSIRTMTAEYNTNG